MTTEADKLADAIEAAESIATCNRRECKSCHKDARLIASNLREIIYAEQQAANPAGTRRAVSDDAEKLIAEMRTTSNTFRAVGQVGAANEIAELANRLAALESFVASHPSGDVERDAERLDFIESSEANEISYDYDDEDEEFGWRVWNVRGRNDREWTEIGRGETLRAAIDAAIEQQKALGSAEK